MNNQKDIVRIWSFEHDAWWAPNSWGYTREKAKAGLSQREHAKQIVNGANLGGALNEEIVEIVAPAPKEQNPPKLGGVELIAAERQRQIEVEGWTEKHDDTHIDKALPVAAACYAMHVKGQSFSVIDWPWDQDSWKPSDDPIRNYVRAGALLAAEIDRLQRAREREEGATDEAERPFLEDLDMDLVTSDDEPDGEA